MKRRMLKLNFVRKSTPNGRIQQLRVVCRANDYRMVIQGIYPLKHRVNNALEFTKFVSIIPQFCNCIHFIQEQN